MKKDYLSVNIPKILNFYDEKPRGSSKHATGFNAFFGEDLAVGLIANYFETIENASVKIYSFTPTTGKLSGYRLDRWIEVVWPNGRGYLYQVEIKNWSAHSFGGRTLSINANEEEIRNYRMQSWEEQWNNENNKPALESVEKVLTPMRKPPEITTAYPIEPMIIFWIQIHPNGANESLYTQALASNSAFKKVWIFSMSSYLRSLLLQGKDQINVYMPNTYQKIEWLFQFFNL